MRSAILTPQQYEKMARDALAKSDSVFVDVIDIYVTPDYISLMWDSIDHDLKHCWKREETQLQWTFEVHNGGRDVNHRVGIESTYKSHSADYVFEIIDVDPKITPQYTTDFRVQYGEVPIQPFADDPNEYICFLRKFPSAPIKPAGFFQGSSAAFGTTLEAIAEHYNRQSSTYNEWQEFGGKMPSSDNVREYLSTILSNSYIPLKEELFGNIPVDNTTVIPPTTSRIKTPFGYIDYNMFDNQPIPRSRSTASVSHHGYKKTNNPRSMISDPAAAKTPEEAYELFLSKILAFTDNDVTKDKVIEYLNNTDCKFAKSWTKGRLLAT